MVGPPRATSARGRRRARQGHETTFGSIFAIDCQRMPGPCCGAVFGGPEFDQSPDFAIMPSASIARIVTGGTAKARGSTIAGARLLKTCGTDNERGGLASPGPCAQPAVGCPPRSAEAMRAKDRKTAASAAGSGTFGAQSVATVPLGDVGLSGSGCPTIEPDPTGALVKGKATTLPWAPEVGSCAPPGQAPRCRGQII